MYSVKQNKKCGKHQKQLEITNKNKKKFYKPQNKLLKTMKTKKTNNKLVSSWPDPG